MSLHVSLVRLMAAVPLMLAVTACDISGIGDGNTLESTEVTRLTGVVDRTQNKFYLCFVDQLQLIGTFSDGQRGDYTARARWTSSNPGVIRVSNGDIQLPSDPTLAYAAGTLLPASVGTSTITAEFVGLVANYTVEVRSPTSFSISPTSLSVAPRTASAITVRALIDGYDLDVTGAAQWSFASPDEDVAIIGAATGIVAGIGTGPAMTARAQFPLCENFAPAQNLSATVNVRPLTSLALTREFSAAPNNELIRGTTDAMRTVASFAGTTETQDVTGQVVYVSSEPTILLPGFSGVRNLATGLAVGAATVTAEYQEVLENPNTPETEATPEIASNPVMFTVVEDTLDTLAVTPENTTITALDRQQFTAIGSYVSGRTQNINRHVTWLSADAEAIRIGNGASGAGLAQSLTAAATESAVKISATLVLGTGTSAVTKTDDALLCTATPGTTPGPCVLAPTTP